METQTNSRSQAITKRLSQAWPSFTRKLADVLAHLGEDQYLVISAKCAHRYVQFAGQGSFGLRVEATSNHYLAAGDRLTRRQLAALKSRGWLAPSGSAKASTPRKDPDGSPNFYVDFELPVPFGEVAELAVDTFSTIFGIIHPGELEYNAFEADGDTILLPELGLKRTQEIAINPTRDELQPRLQNALGAVTGIDDLQPDEEGDFSVRYGAVEIWTVVLGDPSWVRIFAAIVPDAIESPALLARLNSINDGVHRLRFFLHDRTVYAVSDVPANPLVETHLSAVLNDFVEMAGSLAVLLRAEFSNRSAPDWSPGNLLRH